MKAPMIRFKFSLFGLLFLGLVIGVFAWVQWSVINPSLVELPDGTYGEMEGPVRTLRWPFYLCIIAAALFIFWRFFCVLNLGSELTSYKYLRFVDASVGAMLAFVGVFVVWVALIDALLPSGSIGAVLGVIAATWAFRGTLRKWEIRNAERKGKEDTSEHAKP